MIDERDMQDWIEATFDPDFDVDAFEGIEDVRGVDSGTFTATEEVHIRVLEDPKELPVYGHGYEEEGA